MFRPDVIVRAIDRPEVRLVVEVKTGRVNLEETAHQLRQYMHAIACSLGLLVTPRQTYVFQETYTDAPDSIREVAVMDTPKLLGVRELADDGPALERAVQRWLEAMARRPWSSGRGDSELARLEDSLLPALVDAEVTLAGPR